MQAFMLFSNQLFPEVVKQSPMSVIFLIEDTRVFQPDADPAEAIFHRASLQAMRERLLVKGFAVRYFGADEYNDLTQALEALAGEHPEVTRYYALEDAKLAEQVKTFFDYQELSLIELASPVPKVKITAKTGFVPRVLPPIEPNRYVEEAALYYGQLVPITQEIEFAYPVTKGDAEEWVDFLPGIVESGHDLKGAAQDIAPLLRNGLINLAALELGIVELVTLERWQAFRSLLV